MTEKLPQEMTTEELMDVTADQLTICGFQFELGFDPESDEVINTLIRVSELKKELAIRLLMRVESRRFIESLGVKYE